MRHVLATDGAWDDVVARAVCADFYYDRGYHLLEQQCGEGRPILFDFNDADINIALPLLLRPVSEVSGLEDTAWIDATSVRGYVGPLSSVEEPPPGTIAEFHAALGESLRQLGVIAVFSRLHPLWNQGPLLQGLGTLRYIGETVSIDQSRDPADRSEYRENVIRSLNRAKALGLRCREDEDWERLDDFIRVYTDSMQRVNANRIYYFDRSYYLGLRRVFGKRARLLFCLAGDEPAAVGIFIVTRGVVQYHLGGTAARFLKLSPMSTLFDGARHIFAGRHECLHLGGGLGGRADGLFHFKCGFSRRRHRCFVWEWILQPAAYAEACSRAVGACPADGHPFFPLYRA